MEKIKTLSECKDLVARAKGFDNYEAFETEIFCHLNRFDYNKKLTLVYDEAAEMYANQFKPDFVKEDRSELWGYLNTECDFLALESNLDEIFNICNKGWAKSANALIHAENKANRLENNFRELLNKTVKNDSIKIDWIKEAGLTL